MKQLVLFLLLSLSVKLNAQTVLTTYYIIPPVNGCDGVWAINADSLLCNPPIFITYAPFGCSQGYNFSPTYDTLYVQLCSLPCDILIMDSNVGPCASASTGTITNVSAVKPDVFTTYPNPVKSADFWTIILNESSAAVQTEIISLTGQRVFSTTQQTLNGRVEIDTSQLSAGTYIISIIVNGGTPVVQKLVVL
jgi:Secretion system C-terminal sorting domain